MNKESENVSERFCIGAGIDRKRRVITGLRDRILS